MAIYEDGKWWHDCLCKWIVRDLVNGINYQLVHQPVCGLSAVMATSIGFQDYGGLYKEHCGHLLTIVGRSMVVVLSVGSDSLAWKW